MLPVARYPNDHAALHPRSPRSTRAPPRRTSAQAVAAPIEEQLAGLQGLLYYTSANASDGTMMLTITFDVSRDQDLAAVDVQNAVKLAEPQLPQAVLTNGITIVKAQHRHPRRWSRSRRTTRSTMLGTSPTISTLYVVDELKRVPGVGDATAFAELNFAMLHPARPRRRWRSSASRSATSPTRCASRTRPIRPAGSAANPRRRAPQLTLPVIAQGRLQTADQFNDIIVRAEPSGAVVRMRDIGEVVLGAQSYDLEGRLNGTPTAVVLLYARAGANALAVKDAVAAAHG